ncbi:hypothetical protein [Bradyrhizobium sp. USDA 4451]
MMSNAGTPSQSLEHDLEKWKQVFRKIMLKQRDGIMMRVRGKRIMIQRSDLEPSGSLMRVSGGLSRL